MAFARWQRTIVDEAGNFMPDVNIEVRRKISGSPLAVLYSDREGLIGIGNPFIAQSNDELTAWFHVVGGAYRIRAYKGSFEIIWDWVGIGTGSEQDAGSAFVGRGAWDDAESYNSGDMVSHSQNGEVYAFVSNVDDNLNNEPPFESGDVGTSDSFWTVLRLIEAPGVPGTPGSAAVVGTSLSNVAIGLGPKTFTIVEDDRAWGTGARLRISSDANPGTHWMEGVVTDYDSGTDTLDIDIDLIGAGSGSRADWTINIAGQEGTGALGIREVTAAGAVTVGVDDEIILMNKIVGAATNLNFPAAATYIGQGISIKDIKGDAGTNNLTPVFNGAETCDGLPGTDYVININYGDQGVFRPLPSGAGWYIHRR